MIDTKVYARDARGELVAFAVTGAASHNEAISMVKEQTGLAVALAVVQNAGTETQVNELEAA